MAVTLTINGTSYSYPSGTDTEWGTSATAAMQALAAAALYQNNIINDITTGGTTNVLSAEQGKKIIDKATATTKGDLLAASAASTLARLGVGSNTQVLTADSTQATGMKWAAPAGGSGTPEPNPTYAAGSFDYPAANPAPLDTDASFTNGTIKRQLFDDTTNESVLGQFKVPSDIDTTGNVTLKLYGYPVTAASANVVFVFGHSSVAADADIDAAYTYVSSDTQAVINTQDDLNVITWTFAASAWAGSEQCRFILLRDPAGTYTGTDSLTGDFGVTYFEIDIPRS